MINWHENGEGYPWQGVALSLNYARMQPQVSIVHVSD